VSSAKHLPGVVSSSSAEPVPQVLIARAFSRREKVALIVEVLGTYVRATWWLRRYGVTDAVAKLRSFSTGRTIAESSASYDAVVRLSNVVVRTLTPLPSDTRCLARSLVLTGVLARRGFRSTLIIGVSPAPEFKAHAWVEHRDRPVLPEGGGEYHRLVQL
jgi:hypothetical protein